MCPEFLTYLQSTWYSWVRTKHVKVSSSESSFRVTTLLCFYNPMATFKIYSEYVEVFCASNLTLYVLQRQTDWCVVEQVSHLQPGASKQEALSLLRGTANVWKSVEVCGRVGTSGEGERERPLPEPRALWLDRRKWNGEWNSPLQFPSCVAFYNRRAVAHWLWFAHLRSIEVWANYDANISEPIMLS